MIGGWVRHHPPLGFFTLAFCISWGSIVVIFGFNGFDVSPLQPGEGGLLFLAMLVGPSVSGLVCTALVDGTAGLRALRLRGCRWFVPLQWYAVALLTSPSILLLILFGMGVFIGPAFMPQFNWPLFVIGILAASFEEIGWTGFATPRLLARRTVGQAGLLLGLVWAVWHLLVDVRYNIGAMGVLWPVEFVVVYLATLTPYRMLMTWVYSRTQSLLLAILMHASFTGWLMVLFPATNLSQSLIWQSLFALVLWGMVAAVLLRNRTTGPMFETDTFS